MKISSLFDSLPAQLIQSFLLVVVLTAVMAGLPAVWLLHEQLEQQAWSQVEQGSRATEALYAAKQKELDHLAILTAQRPTLRELLSNEKWEALENYLITLQVGAGLDLAAVCGEKQTVLASTEQANFEDVCPTWKVGGFQQLANRSQSQVWLTASHSVQADGVEGEVIIGWLLDDEFTFQLRDQTGLEQIILVDSVPAASSLGPDLIFSESGSHPSTGEDVQNFRSVCNQDDKTYYCVRTLLNNQGIEARVALEVTAISAAQMRLLWVLIGSTLAVAAMGSMLGIFLARHISQPLVSLAGTAEEFRRGDLSSEVMVDAGVREVKEVAQALEEARIELGRTLNHLEREKAWINDLLESIVEGVMTLDHDGCISYFSHGAETITGWKRDEVLGRPADEVFRMVEAAGVFREWVPEPGTRVKLTVELSGGRQTILAVTGAKLAPSELLDAEEVLVFRDIGEEEMVHRLMGHFLANVAHEFRTPLSSLAASIELLFDQAPELSAEELQELLVSLHLSTISLQTLMDNLLESASIEAGRFRVSLRQSDLGWIISETIRMMQPLLDKYGQRLRVSLPPDMPQVRADERRMIQVLVNLFSNAIKYGPADGEIYLEAKILKNQVRVSVADQGSGIPKELRKDVFRRFSYPRSLSNSARMGVGLGLWVVKTVVEAHEGQVGVSDRPGGGAIFWFTLPLMGEE